MGYEIDFKLAVDKDIKLKYFGEYLYDNIICFATTFKRYKKQRNKYSEFIKIYR